MCSTREMYRKNIHLSRSANKYNVILVEIYMNCYVFAIYIHILRGSVGKHSSSRSKEYVIMLWRVLDYLLEQIAGPSHLCHATDRFISLPHSESPNRYDAAHCMCFVIRKSDKGLNILRYWRSVGVSVGCLVLNCLKCVPSPEIVVSARRRQVAPNNFLLVLLYLPTPRKALQREYAKPQKSTSCKSANPMRSR